MPYVTVTGRARYLWVVLKPDRVSDDLVAVIEHELQHAIEILDAELTDPSAIGAMYQRLDGGSRRRVYDTAEARAVGLQVERELKVTNALPDRPPPIF